MAGSRPPRVRRQRAGGGQVRLHHPTTIRTRPGLGARVFLPLRSLIRSALVVMPRQNGAGQRFRTCPRHSPITPAAPGLLDLTLRRFPPDGPFPRPHTQVIDGPRPSAELDLQRTDAPPAESCGKGPKCHYDRMRTTRPRRHPRPLYPSIQHALQESRRRMVSEVRER